MIKDFTVDKLRVRVFETREEMGACAGGEAAACLCELLERKEEVNVIFAAAPSQNETLAALLAEKRIDWSRVNAFHMDEYIGLSVSHPASFRNFLKRSIFDRLPFKSVNLIDGNAENIGEEIARYAKLLSDFPVDVCMLGVGENGHIAFNDPWVADFEDPALIKAVTLDERCRNQQVNDGCFARLDDVPKRALTVTIPALTRAKHMFCSVPAATKAEAIRNMLSGEVSENCPASILTRHSGARLYIDRDAGRLLL